MSPTQDGDIPALLPTALGGTGGPLQSYSRYRSINNHPAAIPRYSALSTWSSGQYAEDENDHPEHATFYDQNEKHLSPSGLNYARRPSSTNWHSTIPRPQLVRVSNSGPSSPVRSSAGVPQSAPSLAHSPTPPSSGADDEFSDGANDKKSTLRSPKTISPVAKTSASKKRNRASLPAHFSLLALTSPGKHPSQRKPSAACLSISRNISKSSHVKTAPSTTAITPTTVHANQSDTCSSAFETSFRGRAERGRSRHRGPHSSTSPGARTDSRNGSPLGLRTVVSPSKSSAIAVSPGPDGSKRRHRDHRTKIHEKVSDWVSTSIDSEPRLRSRSRRYSNESDESEGRDWRPRDGAVYGRGVNGERRGRRRTNELDPPPRDLNGPGFGNGRSGLRDRERRGVVAQVLAL